MNNEFHEVILERLTKNFGEETAVDHISLKIERGQYVFIIGPSGCGKTTTLRMIAGLEEPTSGAVLIRGKNMAKVPVHRRETAMVFQNFALFPHMTVSENLQFGLKARKIKENIIRDKVAHILEMLELNSLSSEKPARLSIGEMQRVALGRALILQPAVLLLDEPLGAMEWVLRERMLIELKKIQQDLNITFIHVTHDKEEAMLIADKIVLMNQGKIEQIDSPQGMFRKPATVFAAKFLQSGNIIEGHVSECSEKNMEVKSKFGKFTVESGGKIAPVGSRVFIYLPYDNIHLKPSNEYTNRVLGIIKGKEVVGSLITYKCQLEKNQELKFCKHMSSYTNLLDVLRENQRIQLCWRPRDAILLTK